MKKDCRFLMHKFNPKWGKTVMTPLAMLTTNLKVSTAKEIVMLTLTN